MVSEKTLRRLQMISPRTREWDDHPESMPKDVRDEIAMMVASTFTSFPEFAAVGMRVLGFPISPMQLDIADYMADQSYGKKKMVQAQRGEAKSTLAALYAVWSLVQHNNHKILVVSAGEKQASDVAIMIIRLIEQWHLLCYLRPDKARGDRSSFEKYDVHCDLHEISKSASVSCMGITANLQGNRADLLIPDDIESQKNAMTQTMRETLLLISKEFAAINSKGETLYLGTPQTKDSIYKSLPGRGYHIRIWPGRFPNAEQTEKYAVGTLAPYVVDQILSDPSITTGGGLSGKLGRPTDPVMFDEVTLIEKELDFGEEGFALQYMLDTTLSDALRTKIKLSDFMVLDIDEAHITVPETVQYTAEARHRYDVSEHKALEGAIMYRVANSSQERVKYVHKVMVVDPAGKGGDEVAFAAVGASNSYLHGLTVGGLIGGVSEENMREIINLCVELEINDIQIESNMGHGTVEALFLGQMEKDKITGIGVTGFYAKGQKERRVIDTVGPLSRRHKIVIHRRAIEDDAKYMQKHSRERQTQMSFFYQISNMTYDRDSLVSDDRADAFAAACLQLGHLVAADDKLLQAKREEEDVRKFKENPMGYETNKRKSRGTLARINARRLQ